VIPIKEDFAKERGRSLCRLVENDIMDGRSRYARVMEHRDLYYGDIMGAMSMPWDGASNIHLPIMQEKVETLVPMLQSAFWGVEPVVNVERSPEEYYPEQTNEVEMFFNFAVHKDIPHFYENFEHWMRNMGMDGHSVVTPFWERLERIVCERHTLKSLYEIGDTDALGNEVAEARDKMALELLTDLFGRVSSHNGLVDARPNSGDETEPPLGTSWSVVFTEDRILYNAMVSFEKGLRLDEIVAKVRRKIIEREGVTVECLEYEDVIFPYRTKSVERADRVTQRYYLTIDEIEDLRDNGEWALSDADMEVLRGRGTVSPEEAQPTLDSMLPRQKDAVLGEDSTHLAEPRMEHEGYAAYNRNKIQVFRTFLSDDPTGDKERVEVFYDIVYALEKIVAANYLHDVYPHGKRPFIIAKYIPVSGRCYGRGLGDQLTAINMECNAIVNYANNAQELVTNPFFFFEPASFTSDGQPIRVRPGQGVPVSSVQGILFPNFPVQPMSNIDAMTSLMMFGDRLTISPLYGGSTQMKNAPRTARGTMAVMGEGHVKVDMLITRLQLGPWTELMEQIMGLYQEFCPDEKWYYVTRDTTKRVPLRMTKRMLRGRYEFTFKGNTANTNRAILQSLAQVRYNTVMTHPDYSTDPNVRRAALRDFLKFWGDGTDIDRLIPALPGQGAYQHPPMSQQDENQVLQLGVPMQVLPTDLHAEHLQIMQTFSESKAFQAFPEHAVALFANHMMQHQEMLRAQAQQAQMPVGAGPGNNVPQGATLAGGNGVEDANVMEGGNMR